MRNKLKENLFKHYIWIIPIAVFVCSIIILVIVDKEKLITLLAAIIGTALSAIYFIQKQKLEEIKLFKELFTEFNGRYDQLNDKISDIKSQIINDQVKIDKILDDYFNLCGEEYLYYTQGYIFPSVWLAWYNGMKFFINNPRINAVWTEEKKSESYYGLTSTPVFAQ